ncbi:MAG: aldo/keto reductase [Verrucomicrobia bacterium]|nr:aldo/keto reductase [Verrucomicrobiota bacterium]
MKTSRRDFLKNSSLALGAGLVAPALLPASSGAEESGQDQPHPEQTRKGDMLYRTLGRTGQQVSLVGLGGFHIGKQPDEADSIRIIRTAIDRGITFLDNSWDYNQGASEIRMGKALRDGYRDKAFLMTKIDGRTKQAAAQQIEESLQRLQTDRLDLLQHHEVIRMEDPDQIFDENGAMAAFLEAKQAGKLRFIGFTGHKDPAVHLRMLEVAGQHGFQFDTVQMPLNLMDAHFRSFRHQVVPAALKEGIGVLGMKSMGDGLLLKSNTVSPIECLHYAMHLPVSVVITGIDSMQILDQAFEAVRTYEPFNSEQLATLLAKTRQAAASGKFELYKTSNKFDSTAQNPRYLGYPQSA